MTGRRRARGPALVAVAAAVLAVVLWWLAHDLVVVSPPTTDTPVGKGPVARTVVDPWPLLGAALSAAVAMTAATLALLRATSPKLH